RVGSWRGVAGLQEDAHITHGFLILLRRAKALDAWAETAFDVILQTRPRRLAINLNVAGAQLKRAIDDIDGATGHRRRQERSKIERAVVLNSPRDYALGKRFVDSKFQVRVRLVIL